MFVSKAARKQNEEGAASRDRSAAIFGECCQNIIFILPDGQEMEKDHLFEKKLWLLWSCLI